MINFTGKLISESIIQTTNTKGKTHYRPVSMYKLDPQSVQDNKVLENLINLWAEEDTFIREIENNFKYNKYNNLGDSEEQFFVLTKKLKGKGGIYSGDVFAVAQTSVDKANLKEIEVDYLQVIPKKLRAKERISLSGIGSKILDELKNIFYGKNLWAYSTNNAADFYKKNGFVQIGKSKVGLPILKYFHK